MDSCKCVGAFSPLCGVVFPSLEGVQERLGSDHRARVSMLQLSVASYDR